MTTGQRVYAALLHLYPCEFRWAYGDAMLETFAEASRDRKASFTFWLFIAGDLFQSLCVAHARASRPVALHVARCGVAWFVSMLFFMGSMAVGAVAVGRPVQLVHHDLHATECRTGWMSSLTTHGVSLSPTVALTLKNISEASLGTVHLNAVFYRHGNRQVWATRYVPAVSPNNLPPHGTTRVVIRSRTEFTGSLSDGTTSLEEDRLVDLRVKVFARHGGSAIWQLVGDWPVQASMLEQ